MASDRDLRVNQKITIEVLAGGSAGSYNSHFVEETADGLVVAAPIVQGAPLTPIPGTLVRVDYNGESAAYSFESELIRLESAAIALWVIAKPDTIQRMQRRTHVRLEVSLPVFYTILARPGDPTPELSAQKNLTVYRGRTWDLSGGGTMLVIGQRLEPGTLIDMEIQLKPGETISLMGEVVRIVRTEADGDAVRHWTGVKFLDLTEREMDAVVGFIFQEQRRLRRRGLI